MREAAGGPAAEERENDADKSRTYEKVTPQRILFFIRAGAWANVSLTMFMTYLFHALWSLTIVGGLIKRCSYYLVPYIAAEDPEIGWRDCMALSKRMMKGHKWECFVFEISFIGWYLLGILTMGLTDYFYTNLYKTAAMAEYFTSYYLELTHSGMHWWDYSGYFLNLNGRICAEGLFVFGVGAWPSSRLLPGPPPSTTGCAG